MSRREGGRLVDEKRRGGECSSSSSSSNGSIRMEGWRRGRIAKRMLEDRCRFSKM
jgi:hypothetical protein